MTGFLRRSYRESDLDAVLAVDDPAAVRFWQKNATDTERSWARRSLNLQGAA